MGPGDQVSQVLDPGANGLHAEQASAARFCIEMEPSAVLQHHPASPLPLEGDAAHYEIPALKILPGFAHHGHLRVGENNRHRAAAAAFADIRETPGIVTGDPSFVGGLVQYGQGVVDISCNEDWGIAALHRQRIVNRDPPGIEFQRGLFEIEFCKIGGPAGCGQNLLEHLFLNT